MTAPLLTITLNPALDLTTGVPRVVSLQKLRCEAPRYNAGGGGVNVTRAMSELGVPSEAFVVLGGSTGQQYRHILDAAHLPYSAFEVLDETRVSFTVIDHSVREPYRFVLPGPQLQPKEVRALLLHVATAVARGSQYVVASGSVPPGVPDDVYARIARMCRKGRQRLVLDSSGPALAAALDERPYIVRINHREARELVGGDGGDASAREACSRLIRERKAEIVIVSVGAQGTLVASPSGQFQISPPHVEIGSTVGAGDSFVAALMVGLTYGWPLPKAATYGVAAAASAVTGDAAELCRKSQTDSIYRQMIDQLQAISPV